MDEICSASDDIVGTSTTTDQQIGCIVCSNVVAFVAFDFSVVVAKIDSYD